MKTVLILITNEFEIDYYVLDGDHTKYNGIMLDTGIDEKLEAELIDMLYDIEGNKKLSSTKIFPYEELAGYHIADPHFNATTDQCVKFIIIGFAL